LYSLLVINALDTIEELYNMYSEKETTPWIMEIADNGLGYNSDLENWLADLYLES